MGGNEKITSWNDPRVHPSPAPPAPLMAVIFTHVRALGSGSSKKSADLSLPTSVALKSRNAERNKTMKCHTCSPKGAPRFRAGLGMTSFHHAVMKRTLKVSRRAKCQCGNVFISYLLTNKPIMLSRERFWEPDTCDVTKGLMTTND